MPGITEQLDAAIGPAPDDAPPLEPTLALGRRALRRRRMTYGAAAAVAAVVIGGTAAWVAVPGDEGSRRSDGPGFSEDPSRPADASRSAGAAPTDRADQPTAQPVRWHGEAARLDQQGRLEVRPGWRVTQDLSSADVIAVEVSSGDRRRWYLFGHGIVFSPDGTAPGYASFRAWVEVNIPILLDMSGGKDETTPAGEWAGEPRDDLVELGGGETLVALDGVTILEQRPSPEVGDSFAAEADRSAVALVEVDGQHWYVLARVVDGPPQYIAVSRSEGGPDLDAFLAFARERYTEGGGGLL